MLVNQAALAPTIIALWKKRGGGQPRQGRSARDGAGPEPPVGYCTTLKFIVGRTPAEMEGMLGLAPESKLGAGADISRSRRCRGRTSSR